MTFQEFVTNFVLFKIILVTTLYGNYGGFFFMKRRWSLFRPQQKLCYLKSFYRKKLSKRS